MTSAIVLQQFAVPLCELPTVGIIGAGLSGLTAAYRLQQSGYDVSVYEGSARAGGRVQTFWAPGVESCYEEFGGKNINDGDEAVSIRALAAELGLEIIVDSGLIKQSPPRCGHEEIAAMLKPSPLLHEDLLGISATATSLRPAVDRLCGSDDQLRRKIDQYLRSYEGGCSDEIDSGCVDLLYSIYGFFYELNKSAENMKIEFEQIKGGNELLIQRLLSFLGHRVHLNASVNKVSRTPKGGLRLVLADGTEVEHEKVICAVPCPQISRIQFDPHFIPDDQIDSISKVSYSSIAKVFYRVRFDSPPEEYLVYVDDAVAWFNVSRDIIGVYVSGACHNVFSSDQSVVETVIESYKIAILQALPSIVEISFLTVVTWPQAYSFFGVGQFKTRSFTSEYKGCLTRTVFRPVNDCLFFAGEHAALVHHATLEGAVQAGDFAAMQVKKSAS
jgi:predicted NAD/FAD-dependent oxidoreductase